MTDVLLIRHGETVGNVGRLVMGRGGDPLNTNGKAQARQLAKFLKETAIDAIYVSPSKRALQTSQQIMRGRDAIPLVEEADVDEIEFGEWIGKTLDELKASGLFDEYMYNSEGFAVPGGEGIQAVQRRAVGAIDKILGRHDGHRVVIISHADVIKAALVHYLEIPLNKWQMFKIDNASMTILKFVNGKKPLAVAVNYLGDMKRYTGLNKFDDGEDTGD